MKPQSPSVFVKPEDISSLKDILPTTYYLAQESKVSCKGKYGKGETVYNGSERTTIIDLKGEEIATVCTRFYRTLLMEGSAILNDRGRGDVTINYGGVVNGKRRFYRLGRCAYGEGVRHNLCLLPYHTLATDNKVHKINEILFIPQAEGLVLPDGTTHDGFFIVRDTGGAFNGIGGQRIDMFTGTDPDNRNVFSKAGFHHRKPMRAYKVKGDSAELVRERMRERFGELF